MEEKNIAELCSAEGEKERMKKIYISRSRSGLPCVGVGGGAFSNTLECRFVLRNKELAKAIFIKRSGHLACSKNQAIVPVRAGDVVVEICGRKPFSKENPALYIECLEIVGFDKDDDGNECAFLRPIQYQVSDAVWEQVKEGIVYHNRDGSYFCTPP